MARTATPPPISKEQPVSEAVIVSEFQAANKLVAMTIEANAQAMSVAQQVGYSGAVTVGALEDEIRFYQRRTVEAILETGKRLLVLKELTPHGEFTQRVEMLGFSGPTARRFMQAANKTAKSLNLSALSTQVKSASAFLELITHDDDVLENLAEMDDIDRLSASELRARLRETKAEKEATDQLLEKKNNRIDQLERAQERISKVPADKALASLRQEATILLSETQGMVQGRLRAALLALNDAADAEGKSLFMAGMVGQLMADLVALRDEFNLPDVMGDGRPEYLRWAEKNGATQGAEA
ncbi:MAG: hypothetical protein RR715_00205 [Comamonas sp.]